MLSFARPRRRAISACFFGDDDRSMDSGCPAPACRWLVRFTFFF